MVGDDGGLEVGEERRVDAVGGEPGEAGRGLVVYELGDLFGDGVAAAEEVVGGVAHLFGEDEVAVGPGPGLDGGGDGVEIAFGGEVDEGRFPAAQEGGDVFDGAGALAIPQDAAVVGFVGHGAVLHGVEVSPFQARGRRDGARGPGADIVAASAAGAVDGDAGVAAVEQPALERLVGTVRVAHEHFGGLGDDLLEPLADRFVEAADGPRTG